MPPQFHPSQKLAEDRMQKPNSRHSTHIFNMISIDTVANDSDCPPSQPFETCSSATYRLATLALFQIPPERCEPGRWWYTGIPRLPIIFIWVFEGDLELTRL